MKTLKDSIQIADTLNSTKLLTEPMKTSFPDSIKTYQSYIEPEKILEVPTELIMSTALAVAGFIIGLLVNAAIARIKKNRELKDTKNYILIWLEDFKFHLTNQLKEINEFLSLLKNRNLSVYQFNFFKIHTEFVLEIEKTKIIDIMVNQSTGAKRDNGIMLTKFLICMDFLNRSNSSLEEHYDLFNNERKESIKEFSTTEKLVVKQIVEFVSNNKTQNLNKDFNMEFLKINSAFKSKLNAPDKSGESKYIDLFLQEFLGPTINLCISLMNADVKRKDIQSLYYDLFNIKDVVKKLDMINFQAQEAFNVDKANLQRALADIKKLEEHFKKEKFISWWKFWR